ncbi:MAG: thiamine pyrophosphate-binding protein [Bryobacterales bacterium]|nr:thiamine pyrophosphate-binding protein [Bryobacterales bacterium]
MKISTADRLIEELAARGVKAIFTLCGHGLDPLFAAARRRGLPLVDTRNEQTAAYAADAFGRLTREPGVCAVSSGVAVANAFAGVANAWFDSAPMLLLSGAADADRLGRGCFQDMDAAAWAAPVTRFSRRIESAETAVALLAEAWSAARGGPGPAHLMLPMDVQRAPASEQEQGAEEPAEVLRPQHDAEPLAAALRTAKRPLIVAGSGIYYHGEAFDLLSLATDFRIPVQTPIWDRGIFDAECPAFLGVAGAATGGPKLLEQADCIVLAGAAPDYRVQYLEVPGKVYPLARGFRSLRERLIDTGCEAFTAWLDEARAQQQAHVAQVRARAEQQTVGTRTHAVHIVEALEQWLPQDAVLIVDGGSIGQWAHQLLATRRYPGHWLTCGRSGVVGYGIGAAMAARIAYPNRPVVLLSGDGAFTFNVADLECAQRQGLGFTAIIGDDQCWGITHAGHLRQFGEGISTQLGPIRFDLLAQSLGCAGARIDRPADIAPRLRDALAAPGVTVLHVPITGGNPA